MNDKSRPKAAPASTGEGVSQGTRPATYLEHFRYRVLQEALSSVIPSQWERRAAALEAGLPRSGDFVGRSTPEERQDRTQRLLEVIAACRRHAELTRDIDAASVFAHEIITTLREAS
jgi:hypothetical protein